MAQTVLVTGGTGYVASWCIYQLLEKGFNVRTTIRNPAKESIIRSAVGVQDNRLQFFIADLTKDKGWDEAARGCDYVLHVASPLVGGDEKDLETFVVPARDGTLRVLRAAVKEKVKRVVMTSAAAAARPRLSSNQASSENLWADPDDPQFDNYRKSKIYAERAAWDFMRSEGGGTEFTTVLPGAVFGPVLSKENAVGSVQIIEGMLKGNPPAIPQIGFYVVDVRDLADAHIRAMLSPEAVGERFICAGEFMWMGEIADTLKSNLKIGSEKISTKRLPNIVVKLLAPFSPRLKSISPMLGKKFEQSSEKAKRVLGATFRPSIETIVECAESLK